MKFLAILATASLAMAPAIAGAGPVSSTPAYSQPAPGPVASSTDKSKDHMKMGGLLLAGGVGAAGLVALALLAGEGGDHNGATTTTATTTSTTTTQ